MAIRKIHEVGDPCLTKVCRPVTEFNDRLHELLDDMADTLEEAGGVGLAAPQVARLVHQTANHHTLLPMSLLWGANMALLALLLGHTVPGGLTLPVNAITPLMGVPVVMMLLTRRG